jgi:cyanophycinase-like exopeptidase
MANSFERRPGQGWLALLGGGEFSFDETLAADEAWLTKAAAGPIGFVPAASGSLDYGQHLSDYFKDTFEREVEVIPIYRPRDGRRGKNAERISAVPAVYLGGGVADHLLEALMGSPAAEALAQKLATGGMVVAIAAAAQCVGPFARSISRGDAIPGLDWLPGGVVEPNFDPDHDRRLRKMLAWPGVTWGIGIPAESALLLGPDGAFEVIGTVYRVEGAAGELEVFEEPELEGGA